MLINNKNAAYFLLLEGMLFSIDGLLGRMSTISGLELIGYRSGLAFLLVSIYLKFPRLRFSKLELLTAFCLTITMCCFFAAIKLTKVANVVFLYGTNPFFAGIWGRVFLKEKFKKIDYFVIPACLIGTTLLLSEGVNFDSFLGNILALLAGIFYSLYALGMKIQDEENPLRSVQLSHLLTFVILLPFFIGIPVGVKDSSIIAALTIFSGTITFIIYSKTINYVTTMESLLIPTVENVLTPIWIYLFFGEMPTILAIIGGVIVLGATTIKSYYIAKNYA